MVKDIITVAAAIGSFTYMVVNMIIMLNLNELLWAMASLTVIISGSVYVTTRPNDHRLFRVRF